MESGAKNRSGVGVKNGRQSWQGGFKRNKVARISRDLAPMKYLSKNLLLSDDKEVYDLGLGFIDLLQIASVKKFNFFLFRFFFDLFLYFVYPFYNFFSVKIEIRP